MNEAEIRLKRSVYELFRVVRMNAHMKKAQAELAWLLDGSDVSLEMFEGRPGSEKLEDAKEFFETLLVKVKESYGTRSVAAAYNRFKAAIDDKAYRESLGLTDELTNEDKSTLFKKAFDMVVPAAEKWEFEDDFFSYFIETVKEIIMPTGEMDTEQEENCPYCDGTPQKISKGEFFGPRSAEGEGYVWGCECGAYAVMSDDGEVHGKLGDTLLHQKRNLLKGAICELCILAGMTSYESWFDRNDPGKRSKPVASGASKVKEQIEHHLSDEDDDPLEMVGSPEYAKIMQSEYTEEDYADDEPTEGIVEDDFEMPEADPSIVAAAYASDELDILSDSKGGKSAMGFDAAGLAQYEKDGSETKVPPIIRKEPTRKGGGVFLQSREHKSRIINGGS